MGAMSPKCDGKSDTLPRASPLPGPLRGRWGPLGGTKDCCSFHLQDHVYSIHLEIDFPGPQDPVLHSFSPICSEKDHKFEIGVCFLELPSPNRQFVLEGRLSVDALGDIDNGCHLLRCIAGNLQSEPGQIPAGEQGSARTFTRSAGGRTL